MNDILHIRTSNRISAWEISIHDPTFITCC